MKLFKIHTEENEKDVDFGIHGVYSDNEKDAIKYVETEIVTDFLSMGYRVETKRTPKYSIVHVWDDENIKHRRILIWAIEKENKNTINEEKWILCSKQPPKENEYYLVQNEYGDMLVAKYIKKDCWEEIYSRYKLGITDKIVAWMSLPKPYNGER